MDRDLLKKLSDEAGLTPAETLVLDGALESGSADGPAAWMRALPQDEPSLAWRSALNEKLQSVSLAEASGGGRDRGLLGRASSGLLSGLAARWKVTTGLVAVGAAVAVYLFVMKGPEVGMGASPAAGGGVASPAGVVASQGGVGTGEDRVVGNRGSDLGVVLLTSHQADEAQLSMGVHAPRRTVDAGFDWSRW